MPRNNDQPAGIPEWGYWLDFSPDAEALQHDFCGTHDIPGAQCPNCSKPLLRVLSLSTLDPKLAINPDRIPFVHLLYCWTCSIPYDLFSYKLQMNGGVELLQVPSRKPEIEFGPEGPYNGYTGVFPLQRVLLKPLSENEQKELKAYWEQETDPSDSHLLEPRHQVGGYPFIFNPEKRDCPICTKEMCLIASICNDASGNNPWQQEIATNTFVDNGGVQMYFHFCDECALVSAAHSCD